MIPQKDLGWPEFKGGSPATEDQIRNFETSYGIELPAEYVSFLRRMNGGEGFVGLNYLVLFPIEKLLKYRQGYGFEEHVPQFLLIGSDGGGEAIAFDQRREHWPVVMVPFVGLEMQAAVPVSPSFGAFFELYSQFSL